MAEEGNTGAAVTAADAKTYLTNFVPDPKALDSMPEPDLLAYHGKVKGFTDKALAEATKANAGKWPENWKQELAGNDEKELAQVGRYDSPQAIWRKARELERQLSSGEYKKVAPYPEKGTPEEQSAWRKQNGLPEAPDKYDIKLKDGKAIPEEDKAQIASLAKAAYEMNMPPAHVNAIVQWMADESARQEASDKDADANERKAYEDTQRAKWGTDYRRNEALIDGLLDTAPKGVKDALLNTRLSDGTLLKNSVGVQDFLAGLALQLNPQVTLVPGSSGNIMTSVEDEIAKIEGWMRAPKGTQDSARYWKDDRAQARYRELVAYRDGQKKKAA